MSKTDCVFCNISQDRVIAQNHLCFAIYDGFPVSRGHVLIIPKRHVADYFGLTEEELMAMHQMMRELKIKLDADFSPDGQMAIMSVSM